MTMGTALILLVLAAIAVAAVLSARKHLKGEGGCCGGGTEKEARKRLDGTVIQKKTMYITGMQCENCQNRVTRQINRIDGAAAKVSWKKHRAVVSMTRRVPDEELTAAVERVGYQVTRITEEVVH